MTRRRIEIRVPPLLGWQRELFRWEPPSGADRTTVAVLSAATGTGKSTGAALRAVRFIGQHCAWDGVGRRPIFVCVAPTLATCEANQKPLLERYLPKDAIVRRSAKPVDHWILFNGCQIIFWAPKNIDAITARGVWVDEVQAPCFEPQTTWNRIDGRLRGPGRKEMLVSGISHDADHLRTRFDRPDDPATKLVLPGVRSNHYLTESDVEQRLRAFSADDKEVVEHGGWLTKPELVYGSMDWRLNRTDRPVDLSKPVVIGCDVGKQASIVIGQRTRVKLKDGTEDDGLDIVGELHVNGGDTEEMLTRLRDELPWRVSDAESFVAIDTQALPDTIKAVRRVFPRLTVIRQPRKSKMHYVETGVTRVCWAICDSFGNRRLKVHGDLIDQPHKRGLTRIMSRYYRRNGRIVKPNDEHVVDALRYLVIAALDPDNRSGQPDYTEASFTTEGGW